MRTIILGIAALMALPSAAQSATTLSSDIMVGSGPQSAFGNDDKFVDRAAFWASYAGARDARAAKSGNASRPELAWDDVTPPGIEGKLPGVIIDIPVTEMPEPGVWAMMVAGFGMVGLVMRRRRGAVSRA